MHCRGAKQSRSFGNCSWTRGSDGRITVATIVLFMQRIASLVAVVWITFALYLVSAIALADAYDTNCTGCHGVGPGKQGGIFDRNGAGKADIIRDAICTVGQMSQFRTDPTKACGTDNQIKPLDIDGIASRLQSIVSPINISQLSNSIALGGRVTNYSALLASSVVPPRSVGHFCGNDCNVSTG